MKFLTWINDKKAKDSLIAINAMYGCPYVAENGYRMDRWDKIVIRVDLVETHSLQEHGFFMPEERLGMKMSDLMPALMRGFTEYEEKPGKFILDEEEE